MSLRDVSGFEPAMMRFFSHNNSFLGKKSVFFSRFENINFSKIKNAILKTYFKLTAGQKYSGYF
jgi:hypothetical protein